MKDEEYILAYDHGTSGMKTAIISTKGKIMGVSVEEYELFHPEQGACEQNPMDWWNALINTTHELLAKNLVPIDKIIAVTTCNQMDGTIPIDSEGNFLHNCITWMDTRGADETKNLCGGIIEISGYGISNLLQWIPKTGGAPGLSGKDITGHILWYKKSFPENYEKTWKFLDCKDYLIYRLSGEVCTSYDCAILTWLVNSKDPNNIHYDEKLLQKTKIDREKLPDLYPSTHIVGKILPEMANILGISPQTKVILGAGDMGAAAVGSGAVKDFKAHICIGSSSWIVTHWPKRKLDIIHVIASLPSAIPGRYMALGEQESAGICLTWLRDKVLYHKDELLQEESVPDVYRIFDNLTKEVEPGEKKIIFTPWLFGERAPVEDHTIRGGIHNLSLDVDRRHIIRAVFEGIAFNSRWLLQYLEKLVGKRLDEINLVGGGAKSEVWCQIYADVLNRTVRQMNNPKEGNSLGAAFIASVALNKLTWDEIPQIVEFKKEFKPREEYREIYDELFKEYINIYKNSNKMYNRLNKFNK